MLYTIKNQNTRPEYNLALEEYLCDLATRETREFFWLWRNEPSVIVSRFQNTRAEIDETFVKEQGIHVVRRNSGGGAVYHDLGNINYSFIMQDSSRFADFRENLVQLTQPIQNILKDLNLPVEFSGLNDIAIHGKKISGCAEWRHGKILLHHGTLLFDTNLDILVRALKNKKAHAERVMNIRPLLETQGLYFETQSFMSYLEEKIGGEIFVLSETDEREIVHLMQGKYLSPKWNW